VIRQFQQFTEPSHNGMLSFSNALGNLIGKYVDKTSLGKQAPNPFFLGFLVGLAHSSMFHFVLAFHAEFA